MQMLVVKGATMSSSSWYQVKLRWDTARLLKGYFASVVNIWLCVSCVPQSERNNKMAWNAPEVISEIQNPLGSWRT